MENHFQAKDLTDLVLKSSPFHNLIRNDRFWFTNGGYTVKYNIADIININTLKIFEDLKIQAVAFVVKDNEQCS